MDIFEATDPTGPPKYYVPIAWTAKLVQQALEERKISAPNQHGAVIRELCDYRRKLAELLGFDRTSFPLLYSQVIKGLPCVSRHCLSR